MKNGFLISLLVLGLAACGGESGSGNPTIKTEFSAGIKGMEAQPALTDATISEGDSASLNTNYTGNVLEDSEINFSFTLTENKLVALVLSSGVSNLDLSVRGNNINLDSFYDDSNELIVFDALAGESYSVAVEAWVGAGEFQLKLVEANRSSVGLADNEYLVKLDSIDTLKCLENGIEQDEYNDNDTSLLIINWSAGYVGDASTDDKTSFSSVDGNAFTARESYSESEDDFSITSQSTLTLLTDFTTGVTTGSLHGSYEYTRGDKTDNCTFTNVETGQVIL